MAEVASSNHPGMKLYHFWEEVKQNATKASAAALVSKKQKETSDRSSGRRTGRASIIQAATDLMEMVDPEITPEERVDWSIFLTRKVPAVLDNLFFRPDSLPRVVWACFGFLLCLWDSVNIPIVVAWEMSDSGWRLAFGLIATVYWTIDLLLGFFTGFYQKGLLVMTKSRACKRYATTWFSFDFLVISIDYMVLMLSSEEDVNLESARLVRSIRLIRIIRLIRLVKLNYLVSLMEDAFGLGNSQAVELCVAVIKVLMIILLASHFLSCFWYFVGRSSVTEWGETQSWLLFYEMACPDRLQTCTNEMGEQYLAALHWVLGQFTPAPMKIHAMNKYERIYNIAVILFALLVMGSCVSKMSATIQQVLRLNADAHLKRRKVNHFLKVNNTGTELSLRILRFVDHGLQRKGGVAIDDSLISKALLKELHTNQRSPLLKTHSLFILIFEAYPKVLDDICGVMVLTVREKNDVIFVHGSIAAHMSVVGAGQYVLHDARGREEHFRVHTSNTYSELSLFVEFLHTDSLTCLNYVDVFTLTGKDLAHSATRFPGCGGLLYQYAGNLLNLLKTKVVRDVVPEELQIEACQKTDIYQILHLDPNLTLENFMVSPEGEHDFGYDGESPLQRLIDTVFQPDTDVEKIHDAVESLIPELYPEVGTHAAFSEPSARNRTIASMINTILLVLDRYDDFTAPQQPAKKLSQEAWLELQDLVTYSGIREDKKSFEVVLSVIALKDLGKADKLVRQMDKDFKTPEGALKHLISLEQDNILPSIAHMDEDNLILVQELLGVYENFNLGQFMQAENTPFSLWTLQQFLQHCSDGRILKLYLISAIGVMSGLGGLKGGITVRGSSFMDEKNSNMLLLGLQNMEFLEEVPCQAVYWNYVKGRAKLLDLPVTSADDLAFARLVCICRIFDTTALRPIRYSWLMLDPVDLRALTKFFLSDGIHEPTILFAFLPQCIENARANSAIGMGTMMTFLVELIESLYSQMRSMDGSMGCELVVDLFELSTFVKQVKSPVVFVQCLEEAQFVRRGQSLAVSLSSSNWNKVNEVHKTPSMESSLKTLLRRQSGLQMLLEANEMKRTQRNGTRVVEGKLNK
eukprot:TRINITY_DN76603_c0_g1_i1.p1 TRINITY_DN76603_c0_g1~~TRINITY_DN76603_c0_g1_i1.p1  ORF type:complete len:1256 (+),score=210.69 TRINITY_DN76603_c0_g1_i1:504-3770(+)